MPAAAPRSPGHRPALAPRSAQAAARPHLSAETTWASAHRVVHPPARSAVGPGEPLRARFLIHDRDGKFPAPTEELLADVGIQTVLTGIRMPRMNAVMERWVQSCRRELLDRCLLWNERHLRHALREYEEFYNRHRAHQALDQAAPLRAVPDPITDPAGIVDLKVRRRDRLGGVLHQYSHAA
ncbi:integrase core domain-containing protein [Nonomuraea angiospora]|uniref:integrase core domain-containing protein n=1 Tax=Nonomuraea angiospora TaxID=46172 RepID=UPI00360FFCEC